jgi:formate-dependent nitrite reductase membrane component NrfD
MATYTGVLIGATAIPVWNENIDSLPIHFALSGLGAGVSAIQLMGREENRSLNMLGIAASLGETLEGVKLETAAKPANEPLKKGVSGAITRLGGLLSGPLPLALRLAAAFAGERRSKQLTRVAAAATLAGSFLTRVGWVRAGHASARDYRLPLEIARRRTNPGLALTESVAD